MRVSLKEAMAFLKEVDVWHEFKFSDDQLMRVAPELQDFGREVLARALELIKTMEKKPSPAKIMQLCREQQINIRSERALETSPEEDPSTWMTSKEYARTQGFDTLLELIKHKIEEQQASEVKGSSNSVDTQPQKSTLDPSIEKAITDMEDSE